MPIFQIGLTIRDGDNGSSQVTTYADAVDFATATTRATEFAGLVDDIILGQVESVRVTQDVTSSAVGLKSTPASNADKEIKAEFTFSSVVPKVKPQINIPTFDKDTYTVAGGSIPFDLASGVDPISLLLIAMTGGNYADYRGALMDGVLKAEENFT